MEREYYIVKMEKLNLKENGLMINMKDMENIFMKMDHFMKVNLKIV